MVLFSSQKYCALGPKLICCSNPWFFGDNNFSKKFPDGVQSWNHSRRFITLYSPHIHTDEEKEEGSDSEEDDDKNGGLK